MDNSFNGLRYSSTLDCLVAENGEHIRMRQQAMQIFLLLRQDLNKLVTIERLLSELPTKGVESENSINSSIAEISLIVGHACLKTIPRVGYLLTPDTKTNEAEKCTNGASRGITGVPSRPFAAMFQKLVFNSQWLICIFRKKPYTWTGSLVLLTAILLSTSITPTSTAINGTAIEKMVGQLVKSSTENPCSSDMADCTACGSQSGHSSSIFAQNSWSTSFGCKSGS